MNAVADTPETVRLPKVRRPEALVKRLMPSLPPLVHDVFPKLMLEVTAAAVLLTVIHVVAQFEIVVEPMLMVPVTLFRVRPCPLLLFEDTRSEEHTSELQSQFHLVCRLLLEKKKKKNKKTTYKNNIINQ